MKNNENPKIFKGSYRDTWKQKHIKHIIKIRNSLKKLGKEKIDDEKK